jgi:hypothetical protein
MAARSITRTSLTKSSLRVSMRVAVTTVAGKVAGCAQASEDAARLSASVHARRRGTESTRFFMGNQQ